MNIHVYIPPTPTLSCHLPRSSTSFPARSLSPWTALTCTWRPEAISSSPKVINQARAHRILLFSVLKKGRIDQLLGISCLLWCAIEFFLHVFDNIPLRLPCVLVMSYVCLLWVLFLSFFVWNRNRQPFLTFSHLHYTQATSISWPTRSAPPRPS